MSEKKCLNCHSPLENNFCSVCGQKTSTHRYSWKHLLVNDFFYGILNFDKGFFFTIKELYYRPGHSIREYIQGKRVRHFNAFSLLLIIIAVNHFIGQYTSVSSSNLYQENNIDGFLKILRKYNSLIRMLIIPIWAFITYLSFRKSKQNYIEHVVITAYMMCGVLILYPLYSLLTIFYSNVSVLRVITDSLTFYTLLYFTFFMYQYYSGFNYKKYVLLLHSFLTAFILLLGQSALIKLLNAISERFFV